MFVCPECGAASPAGGACPLDGTQLAPIGDDVLLGTTIGAYRVARLLGIGGMGRVYKGVHPTIGSRVAIKVLSRECTDRRDLVDRFFAEAKAVNLIRHESIVNVLDLAVLPDGRPYIIMEYLDGAPLASIIDHAVQTRTPLPLGGLAKLAVEVLDALGAAHGKGIVHRDLKPDNIFVTPSGRPKVLDFGIAKLSDPGSGGGSTRTGSLLGTPHYMAPEQAAGKPVDHRADIYAMGVILFECVTGAKPFVAESLFELLRKHVEEPPPSPRSLRPDLEPSFEHVILCALSKQPDQRFATAQAMSMALQHATAHLPAEQWTPITGSGTHRAQPSSGWQQRSPVSWGGGSRAHARPSNQPLDPAGQPYPQIDSAAPTERQRGIGHQSTVSASSGQVSVPTKVQKPSRRNLWLALVGLGVIGGAVTIGVLAARGSDTPTPVARVDEPPPPPSPTTPAPTPNPPAGSAAIEAKQDPPPPPPPADDPAKPPAKRAADKVAVAPADAGTASDPKPHHDTVGKQAAALAPKVEDDADDAPATPSKQSTWVDNRALSFPGFNAKRVNVDAFVKFALAEAKKAVPDAKLTRITASGVSPDGYANLTLRTLASDHGDIELRFVSLARAKPPPDHPIGVPWEAACEFRIEAEPDGVEIRPVKSDCKERTIPPPKCGAAQLWKLAIGNNAPATNAVAEISYYQASMHNKPRFFFDIGFGMDKAFSHAYTPDDCP
ncbi:MAG TPA: serine/threonine-protein kinase [Kofleriaceae bacterium]|nr:serine/threonine-protein kinase [Kofleriaceae bacterium]